MMEVIVKGPEEVIKDKKGRRKRQRDRESGKRNKEGRSKKSER